VIDPNVVLSAVGMLVVVLAVAAATGKRKGTAEPSRYKALGRLEQFWSAHLPLGGRGSG
jgi:hypothetical protein